VSRLKGEDVNRRSGRESQSTSTT